MKIGNLQVIALAVSVTSTIALSVTCNAFAESKDKGHHDLHKGKQNNRHQNWPAKPWPKGMVWIPGGEFMMGGSGGPTRKDEFPVHKVRIDGFWMDETEVTNAQFRKFVKATKYITTAQKKPEWSELKKQLPPDTPEPPPSKLVPGALVFHPTKGPVSLRDYSQWWTWTPGANWMHPAGPASSIKGKNRYPVTQVSWEDAEAYCKWAGKRLPTEAEYEFAARGGKPCKAYEWGDDPPDAKKHRINYWQGGFPYSTEASDGYLLGAPVKSFPANDYGLYEIIGNVWEWCGDWYRNDYYQKLASTNDIANNPLGPDDSFDPDEPYMPKRVVRGGSFLCNEKYCASYRPSARMKEAPDTGMTHLGFRGVMTDAAWRKIAQTDRKQ